MPLILVLDDMSTAEACYKRHGIEAFCLLFNGDDVCIMREC